MPELRFTTLLAYLEREEDAARRQLAARERERDGLIARRQALEGARAVAAAGASQALREQLARYWAWSGAELHGLVKSLAACDERIAGARAALTEAHRQVRTFTRLRERDQRGEQARSARRRAAELDEFAATRSAAASDALESAP